MSVATKTTNYGLPIFAGTDHGNWFDFNTGFQAIDTAIKAAAQAAESAQTAAAAATELANSASSLAGSVNTNLTQYKTDIDTWINCPLTIANASIFQNIYETICAYNPVLNLMSLVFTGQVIANKALPLNTVILNIGNMFNITSNRTIVNGLTIIYPDSSNNYKSNICDAQITTNKQLVVYTNTALPSDYDQTKGCNIRANLLLNISGWQ